MLRLLTTYRPSLPPVAVLLEPPNLAALRVVKARKDMTPLVRHEEHLEGDGENYLPGHEEMDDIAASLLARLGEPKRISLVLGDPFFRMQVLTLDDFPRQEKERHQVILWHIRKVLNYPIDAVRLRYEVLQRGPGGVTLWLTLCPEDEVKALEAAFSKRGCQVGYIGAASVELFNLGRARDVVTGSGSCLLINRTPNYLSFLFAEEGQPVFFRCKETRGFDGEDGAMRIQQELRLTLAYHREKISGKPLSKIVVRRFPHGVPLPLEDVLEEGTLVEEWGEVLPPLPGEHQRGDECLPIFGLLESN